MYQVKLANAICQCNICPHCGLPKTPPNTTNVVGTWVNTDKEPCGNPTPLPKHFPEMPL